MYLALRIYGFYTEIKHVTKRAKDTRFHFRALKKFLLLKDKKIIIIRRKTLRKNILLFSNEVTKEIYI